MSSLRLVLKEGDATPSELDLESLDQVVIGRADDCDVVLGSTRASRRHAALVRAGDGFKLDDLGSSVGTKVNGRFVRQQALSAGDTIEVAGVVLELVGAEPAADPGPEASERALLDGLLALLGGKDAPVPELLADMLDRLVEAFGADRGAVFLPEDGELVSRCLRLSPRASLTEADPISRNFIAEVAAAEEARTLSSAETEELRDSFASVGGQLRSILAAPLPVGEASGVLYLDSAMDRRRFLDRDRDLLLAFARAAGVALDRERSHRRLEQRDDRARERRRRRDAGLELRGASGPMETARDEIQRAAATDVTVLISGESGTGKELAARALHRLSKRDGEAFVAVNCAAIPPELVESELFGHEDGAFTGARGRRLGQFELADGGTLFLDEVGELPAAAQAKLLRVLQERQVQRVGASRPVRVDFRLVCASHVDLEEAVKDGRFREDLFYRIAVYRLGLPPLRERGADVVELAEHFLETFTRNMGRTLEGFAEDAVHALQTHAWPGNVRELRNAVEQSVIRARGSRVTAGDLLPGGTREGASGGSAPAGPVGDSLSGYPDGLEAARKEFERRFILRALEAGGGNMKGTAEALGISRRNLYTRCDELGIDYKQFR
jgi:transcriptional regulator with GAF, ATPase, and Fis domain